MESYAVDTVQKLFETPRLTQCNSAVKQCYQKVRKKYWFWTYQRIKHKIL